MNTTDDPTQIKNLFQIFTPDGDGAFPTCRCLPGQYEQQECQEWAERGTINDEPATLYWIFENDECEVEDGADMPFDVERIDRIEFDEREARDTLRAEELIGFTKGGEPLDFEREEDRNLD